MSNFCVFISSVYIDRGPLLLLFSLIFSLRRLEICVHECHTSLPLDAFVLLQLQWEDYRHFAAIAAGVCMVAESEVDQFWVASRFFTHLLKHRETISHYVSFASSSYFDYFYSRLSLGEL
jgi:hypothetical protein